MYIASVRGYEKFFKFVLDVGPIPPYKARSRRLASQKILGTLLKKLQCFSAFSLGLMERIAWQFAAMLSKQLTYRSFGIVTGIRADKKED